MSVWANGPDPTIVDIPGIAEAMRPVLYEWMTAHVRIYDTARANAGDDYDPTADTGGVPTRLLVLDSGANGALIQPLRSPTRIEVGSQPNALLGIRFQIKAEPTTEGGRPLRGGLVVEVVDGGNDSDLERYLYSLQEAVASSLMWGRIFEATVITGGV